MLDKFGQVIFDYFLSNYPKASPFKLSVDDYLFSEFANMAGVNEQQIISLIQSKDTYVSTPYVPPAWTLWKASVSPKAP